MKPGKTCRVLDSRGTVLAALLGLVALSACATTTITTGTVSGLPDRAGDEVWSDDIFELSAAADLAYRESRWLEAARLYGTLTESVPEDPYAWFRLGNTYAQQGAFDRAITAYEASLARNVEQPKPWFNLSTAYLLSAQAAMKRSWEALRPGDPARLMIEQRLTLLDALMHDRIEDSPSHTGLVR